MRDDCNGNCLACGKCANFAILDSFRAGGAYAEPREGFGIAVDIGTTTVVLALLDLNGGCVMARHSFMNPQRVFGPDVISRIQASNEGHVAEMRRLIIRAICAGLSELLAAGGVLPGRVAHIAIAGNTTMTYLLLGFPCGSLGAYPFRPAYALAGPYAFAEVFGMEGITCPLFIFPWFTAFVGGDVLAGLLHVAQEGKKPFLLIDMGTNGEMGLMEENRLIVTSTAAGPAFESGRGGASGVIHGLAELVRAGAVDETGLLLEGEGTFTQKQIRDLQLAKSAVRTGLEILLETAGMSYGDLGAVYLAGGIGQAMDVRDAVEIGLLPRGLRQIAMAAGNSSLGGAALYLGAPGAALADITSLRAAAREINLAEHPRFNDCFMEYMVFE